MLDTSSKRYSKNQIVENSRCFSVKFLQHSNVPPVLSDQKDRQPIEQIQATTNNLLPDELKIITVIRSNNAAETDSGDSNSYTQKVTISNSDINLSNTNVSDSQFLFSSNSRQNYPQNSLQNSFQNSLQNSLQNSFKNSNLSPSDLSPLTDSMFPPNTSSISKLKLPVETTNLKTGLNFTPEHYLIPGENCTSGQMSTSYTPEHITSEYVPTDLKTTDFKTTEYIATPVIGDLLSKIGELERNIKSCQRLITL
jgi:hypothetical protein